MDQKDFLPNLQENRPETIYLGDIFWRYFSHWRWILLSITICMAVGFVYLKIQPNVFQFSATVLVKGSDDKGAGPDSKMLEELGLRSGGNVENEVEVFRSKRLLFGVVDSLGLNVSYYYKTVFKRLKNIYTDTPYLIKCNKSFLQKLGSRTVQMTIETVGKSSWMVKGEYDGVPFTQPIYRLPSVIITPCGLLNIEKWTGRLPKNVPLVVIIKGTKAAIGGLSVQSTVGKKNNIITLSTTAEHPKKGIDVLNTLIESYNIDAMNQINQSAKNTSEFIDQRLKKLTVELSDVEKDVEMYKRKNGFTDISSEASSYMTKSNDLDQRRINNQTQIRLIQFVEDFISNEKNIFSPIPNLGIKDAGLSSVLMKFNEILLTRSRIAESSSLDNPVLQGINRQIYSYRKDILISIKNVRHTLKIEQEDIKRADNEAMSRLNEIPRQEREFIEIKRQQEIKAQLYVFLLQRREESALTMALTVPKAVVINEAEMVGQIAPKKSMIMMISFMLGFLIPIVIIYLLDLFNNKIISRKEVEALCSVPVLSEITHSDGDNTFAVFESGLDSTNELFRLLRVKMNFILSRPLEKVVLVTSTEPGEGKTFISINLSLSLALADKKVLLVGLDLRKPKLADKFDSAVKEGITSYLSDQETDINKLIFTHPDHPNMHILPAGIIPPNPNELLMREKLDEVFRKFRNEYDYIVIDTAPVGLVSDALLINRVSDISLYICRSGYTQKKSFEIVNRLVKEKTIERIYLIINDMKVSKGYGKYDYNYNYSYGYGYSNYKPENKKSDKV